MTRTSAPIHLPDSEWLTTEEAAAHLKTTLRGFYRWLEKRNVPHGHFGRNLRFQRHILDAFISRQTWTLIRIGMPTKCPECRRKPAAKAVTRPLNLVHDADTLNDSDGL